MSKTASGLSPKSLKSRLIPVPDEPATEEWERHVDIAVRAEAAGEERQWDAKGEYEAAWSCGATERQIADRAGKARSHIHRLLTMVSKPQAQLEGLSFAEAYAKAKRPEPRPAGEPGPLPDGVYRTIVADPPWRYDNKATRGAVGQVAPGRKFHYDTMSVEAICDLEPPAADDSHLYLWTTNAFLRPAFDVMEAWDFAYKTCLTWVKPQIGLGNYFRNATEHVLFGVRGRLATNVTDVPTYFEARRGQHSAKPDSFLDMVETASPGPYLEMFARRRRMGWDVWGAEA